MDFFATSGNRGVFDDEATALGARIFYLRYGRSNAVSIRTRLQADPETRRVFGHPRSPGLRQRMAFCHGSRLAAARARDARSQSRLSSSERNAQRGGSRRGSERALLRVYSTHITGTSRQVIAEYGFDAPTFRRTSRRWRCIADSIPRGFLGIGRWRSLPLCHEFGWPEDAKIILFAGRIDRSPDLGHPQNHKNSGFAVSVGIECARRDPRCAHAFCRGESPAVPILEERIAAAGLEGRIQFAGIRKDIERLMLASDVLLFPSRGEGLGMVAVEAQAAGLPVLVSDAVPRECVVVPELVRFQKVEAGEAAWAADLLQLAVQPRNIPGQSAGGRVRFRD